MRASYVHPAQTGSVTYPQDGCTVLHPFPPSDTCSLRFNKVNTAWIKFLGTFWLPIPFAEHKSFWFLLRKNGLSAPLLSWSTTELRSALGKTAWRMPLVRHWRGEWAEIRIQFRQLQWDEMCSLMQNTVRRSVWAFSHLTSSCSLSTCRQAGSVF